MSTGVIDCKVVFLGSTSVGKTSIVNKATTGTFDPEQNSTVGATYSTKIIELEDKKVKLQIWDTAGQERYRSLTPMYYFSAQVAIIVFSLTSRETLEEAKKWVKELENHLDPMPILYLIGNKSDLENEREVKTDEAEQLAEQLKANYFETSAVSGSNITELFTHIAESVEPPKDSDQLNSALDIGPTKGGPDNRCC